MKSSVRRFSIITVLMGFFWPNMAAALPTNNNDLIRLLEQRSCQGCLLGDADLVHADLRDAQLLGAQLQHANLSGARLEGADLRNANLSFTNLEGASLRGADLRGAILEGTNLRRSDLSGAQLDSQALSRTHWQNALGINPKQLSFEELHNAGVEAARQGRHTEADSLYSNAILKQPNAAISWVARGISRINLGEKQLAAEDLDHAASLYLDSGDQTTANELAAAAQELRTPPKQERTGNNLGSQLAIGAMTAIKLLAPIAAKAFIPTGI